MAARKKKVYLVLIGASLGGYAIDRAFFGEPQGAAAQTTPGDPAGKGPVVPAAEPAEDAPPVNDPSVGWLEKLETRRSFRDVFSPSLSMLQRYQEMQREQTAQELAGAGPEPGSPEAFSVAHELQGTYLGAALELAVVDGKVLRVGDTLDDYRLTHIEPYGAEFQRGADRAKLFIPIPQPPE